jgi:GH15 family glucan-1,4-alpha-glucosidase
VRELDWWCLPNLDLPSVFGALLDADRGDRFALCPEDPAKTHRRYVPDTNVVETTFTTATGRVRVTDALTLPRSGLEPFRDLARRVEGLDGRVPMRRRVEPRFGYGLDRTRIEPQARQDAHPAAFESFADGERR